MTRRPRSKLERVLDRLGASHEVPPRPEVDLAVQVVLSCLVAGQVPPAAARGLVRAWTEATGTLDAQRLLACRAEELLPHCPAERLPQVLSALAVARHLVQDGAFHAEWDVEDTRRALLGIPGMTTQHADYLLLAAGRLATVAPTLPAMRVSVRVGYPGSTYGAVARALDLELPRAGHVASAWRAHQLLDRHGRTACTAQAPSCAGCSLEGACSYAGEGDDPALRLT